MLTRPGAMAAQAPQPEQVSPRATRASEGAAGTGSDGVG
jgi:hypothetical protein